MIRINLLGETEDKSGLYMLQTLMYCVLMCATAGACFFYQQSVESEIERLKNDKATLSIQLSSLKRKTQEVQDLQKKEDTLREKLSTIAVLKAKKHGPVHVLNDLADAIPAEAWVGQVEEHNGFLEVYGAALDEHIVAKFMQNLEKSKYFNEVKLIESELYLHTENVVNASHGRQGVQKKSKLKRFSLAIKLTDPLLLRTGSKQQSDVS